MGFELPLDPLLLVAGVLLVMGVMAAALASRTRMPALLLFLALGMAIGDDGLGLIRLSDPRVAQTAGVLALLAILFEGGLTTRASDLRAAAVPGFVLATLGVVLTAAVVSAGVLVFTSFDVTTALLLGAVVSSTDAAAVFTVVRRSPLPRRITSLLEVESGANDPMAVLLTIGILEAWRADLAWHELALFGVAQIGGGLVLGAAVGAFAILALRHVELGAAALYPVLALGFAAAAYGVAAAAGGSGFLAVYVCGLLVGLFVPGYRRGIRTFHQGLAGVAEISLFLLLGLLVFPSELPPVAVVGLAVTAMLIVVARPVAVYASLVVELLTRRWSPRALALVSWAGLRGAVPIVLATFPLTAAHPDGAVIFNIVFFVVLVSTAVQGTTIPLAANTLGLREDTALWSPAAEILPIDDHALDVIEIEITNDLPIAGRLLREVPLPPDARLAVIQRGDETIVPTGETRLMAGDRAVATAPRRTDNTSRLTDWAHGR
jgi:cell volume regulation protein A